jgi:hypothetical protein
MVQRRANPWNPSFVSATPTTSSRCARSWRRNLKSHWGQTRAARSAARLCDDGERGGVTRLRDQSSDKLVEVTTAGHHRAEAMGRAVLMFSGGRDSTIAAVRLSRVVSELILVTVTSSHLVGIDRVRQRIAELRPILPRGSTWLHVGVPSGRPGAFVSSGNGRVCRASWTTARSGLASHWNRVQLSSRWATPAINRPGPSRLRMQRPRSAPYSRSSD